MKDPYIDKIYKQVYPEKNKSDDVLIYRIVKRIRKTKYNYEGIVLFSKYHTLQKGSDCFRDRHGLESLKPLSEDEVWVYMI